MIEINLLPSGATRRAPAARGGRLKVPAGLPKMGAHPLLVGFGALVLLLFVGAGFTYWQSGEKLAELEDKVAAAREDSVRMAKTLSMMDQLEARRDTMTRKMDVIRSVDGRRYVWPHLLDEISRAVPQYTWLTKVTAEEEAAPPAAAPRRGAAADSAKAAADSAAAAAVLVEPSGPAFTIEGSAGSTQALTRFMKNLEASPMIMAVTLVTSEQAVTEGRSYQKFTLDARYEKPDSALVETVPVITAP